MIGRERGWEEERVRGDYLAMGCLGDRRGELPLLLFSGEVGKPRVRAQVRRRLVVVVVVLLLARGLGNPWERRGGRWDWEGRMSDEDGVSHMMYRDYTMDCIWKPKRTDRKSLYIADSGTCM